jgi:hypothetical protein
VRERVDRQSDSVVASISHNVRLAVHHTVSIGHTGGNSLRFALTQR